MWLGCMVQGEPLDLINADDDVKVMFEKETRNIWKSWCKLMNHQLHYQDKRTMWGHCEKFVHFELKNKWLKGWK